ncbi:hypothetical protein V6N13_135203 [Hibiscus sabdariffa]|uniref:At1g61320/AtMIF1 LRR domain-containing protein n=1 Tax=Hibiscus sabdariffa TaxID=183260 RepID=A0ABR2R646_9ROSI
METKIKVFNSVKSGSIKREEKQTAKSYPTKEGCHQINNVKDGEGHDIDSWFHFAISKRVRKLELDFEEVAEETWPPGLRSYSLTKSCFDYIQAPPGLSCIGSLNSLCLRFVKVSGEVLEHFLMHCPLLEKLVVEWSKSLVSLKVASSSPLRLQYLEIRSCLSLQNLEISAPNLRTFLYYGQKMALYIEDAPVLANVLIGGNLDDEPAFAFCPLSSYLCQLETLTLEMSAYNMMFLEFPKLTKLRHLVVIVYGGYDDDLLVLTSLIDAAPSLNKLTLELKIWRSATYNHHAHSSSSATGKPIHSLKEVEVTGFRGALVLLGPSPLLKLVFWLGLEDPKFKVGDKTSMFTNLVGTLISKENLLNGSD